MSGVKIDATIPFHLARVYGAPPIVRPMAPSEALRLEGASEGKSPRNVSRLIAGSVPGGVDFSGVTPQPSRASLPFYRHPADQNAAATSLATGRMVDVTG